MPDATPHPAALPRLRRLAREALRSGSALLVDRSGRAPTVVPAVPLGPVLPAEPLLGVRCSPAVAAVGYPAAVTVVDGETVDETLVGVAVGRSGAIVVVSGGAAELGAPEPASVAFDVGLRSLGLATPVPTDPVARFVDAVWLDAVLDLVLTADLGRPPGWCAVSRRHPLSGGAVSSPEQLRARRADLPGGWESLRRSVARTGGSGPLMSASLAGWLDEGSFARRMLASVPDPELLLPDLDELLRPREAELLRAALRPTLGIR